MEKAGPAIIFTTYPRSIGLVEPESSTISYQDHSISYQDHSIASRDVELYQHTGFYNEMSCSLRSKLL
jgi:hypothetical protein